VERQLKDLQLGKLSDGLGKHLVQLEEQVSRLKGKRDWYPLASAVIVQVLAGAATVYVATNNLESAALNAQTELQKARSTKFHELFQQSLKRNTDEETRLATLTGVCLQDEDPQLAIAAKYVIAGLARTCWDICNPKLASCREKKHCKPLRSEDPACHEECETITTCDDFCAAYDKYTRLGGLCEAPFDLAGKALAPDAVIQEVLYHIGRRADEQTIREVLLRAKGPTGLDVASELKAMANAKKVSVFASQYDDDQPPAKACIPPGPCFYALP
jgi:hypothetical protein